MDKVIDKSMKDILEILGLFDEQIVKVDVFIYIVLCGINDENKKKMEELGYIIDICKKPFGYDIDTILDRSYLFKSIYFWHENTGINVRNVKI